MLIKGYGRYRNNYAGRTAAGRDCPTPRPTPHVCVVVEATTAVMVAREVVGRGDVHSRWAHDHGAVACGFWRNEEMASGRNAQ